MAGMRPPHLRVRPHHVTANTHEWAGESCGGTVDLLTRIRTLGSRTSGFPRRRVLSSARDSIFAELQQWS